MKRLTCLFYILVATAFVKSTTGKVAGNVAISTGCTILTGEGRSMDSELHSRALECLLNIAQVELTSNPPTNEEIREKTRDFCGNRAKLTQCLDKAKSDADGCSLSETQRTGFRLFRQYKELEHEVGCVRNGEDLATISLGISNLKNNFVGDCKENATVAVEAADTRDPNGFMVHEYRVYQVQRQCLEGHKGEGHDSMIDMVISMIMQMMDRMKCDQDGTDVLCKTIITN